MNSNETKETNRLFDIMEEGLVSAEEVVHMCVEYMGEDDVADMMLRNELSEVFSSYWLRKRMTSNKSLATQLNEAKAEIAALLDMVEHGST